MPKNSVHTPVTLSPIPPRLRAQTGHGLDTCHLCHRASLHELFYRRNERCYFPLPRMPSKTLARFPHGPAPMPPPPSPTGPCTCLLALIICLCNHLVYLGDSSSRAMTSVCETSACQVTLAQQMLRRCLMNGTWAEKEKGRD